MDWKKYQRDFKRAARQLILPDNAYGWYVATCLAYASRLNSRKLPVIFDGSHFCKIVGYKPQFVYGAANAPDRYYRKFEVPKRSGGIRVISEPLPSLKEIQRWILDNIVSRVKPSRFAKGFRRGYSIKDNARFHIGQPIVISVDIEDFFPSISFSRVYGIFVNCGYSHAVATLLTSLCILDDGLPQGAPTSPALSNLVASNLDRRISDYVLKHGYRFTRYADDIALSGLQEHASIGAILSFLNNAAGSEGFRLNPGKTRVLRQGQRQEVTGVVVNKRMAAPRALRRKLRQTAYYVNKFGLRSHMEHAHVDKRAYVEHLLGKANYVLFLNPEDRDAQGVKTALKRVS